MCDMLKLTMLNVVKWKRVSVEPYPVVLTYPHSRPSLPSCSFLPFWPVLRKLVQTQKVREPLRLCLRGAGLEPFRTKPNRIGFCLHETVWNRSKYLHQTVVEPIRKDTMLF